MIWYLLYPFRGTTEAPVLAPSHPLRSAFTRYGRYAARHVLTTLLISVAVAAILIYPFPFLYSKDFTNGASNIPLHVWTDAEPLNKVPVPEPDVFMRTIWVHGSYMRALDRHVLLGASELQDEILGSTRNFSPLQPTNNIDLEDPFSDLTVQQRDTFHVSNGLTNKSWFYHSPLQYWKGDPENILHDQDLITTVNDKKTETTTVNTTLRHSIVFSGKHFEDRRLIAADALVITLIHMRDCPLAKQWERKTEQMAIRMADKWDVFPSNGVSPGSQLYKFQFRPISLQDKIILTLAYFLTFTYFLLSLSKIRAVKSKLGLITTVVAQIAMAIMSSLTICAVFKIDLSRIPRAAYPLVLVAMSLENIFRLINSVIMTPADHTTSSRIGHAFGETAHVSLASVSQNLLILWGLSKMVSSGVSAFCTFAAIAILFDFFYLSTFFLAVLSVDVRRTELGDALDKAASKNKRSAYETQPRPSMIDAILQGKIALSTRIAGTVVMLGFVLVAQWHFFESDSGASSPGRLLRFLWRQNDTKFASNFPLAEIHQARSPKSWLRLQDHETAREVINIIKPLAHSYIARVYDPVIFVSRDANRSPAFGTRWFPDAVYDFANYQLTSFILTVLVLVAAVWLLMNYLLWDEMVEAKNEEDPEEDKPLLSVRTLTNGHHLDVAMLSSAPDGQVVSVGLDRIIRAWNVRYDFAGHVVENPSSPDDNPFPVLALAIDDDSDWMAILSTHRVLLWSLTEQRWGPSMAVDLYGQKPEAFFFGLSRKKSLRSLIIVRRNGTMVELWNDVHDSSEYVACERPLICAVPLFENPTPIRPLPRLSVVTLCRRACIHRADFRNGIWVSSEIRLPPADDKEPHSILPVQVFSAYMVVRSRSVDLVDLYSSTIIHTFETEPMHPRSMKFVYHGQRVANNGSSSVASLTLAYNALEDGDCVLQTYLPDENSESICFSEMAGPPARSSCPWLETKEVRRRVANPGTWLPLRNGCIVGVRQKKAAESGNTSRERSPLTTQAGLRRRGVAIEHQTAAARDRDRDAWEAWVISRLESEESIETTSLDAPEDLIISKLGPMTNVGYGSVVVGFGTVVKLITVGHDRFDGGEEETTAENLGLAGRRRRVPGSRTRASSNSHAYHRDE